MDIVDLEIYNKKRIILSTEVFVKILRQGKKQQKQQQQEQGRTAEEVMGEYYANLRKLIPEKWRGPHQCPGCSCTFELERSEKHLVFMPDIESKCPRDYYGVYCPNCSQEIRL